MPEAMLVDYIIVGAGSAGCVLANRLSEDPANKVLLLEAGGDDRPTKNVSQFMSNLMIHVPVGYSRTLKDPKVNWLYPTEPDPGTGGRVHVWPRGKVLGGSSSINGLLYIRGQHADYDGWRQLGCEGWGWDDVRPYFLKSQHQERGAGDHHATGGPLNVSDVTTTHEVSDAVVEACVEAGIPRNPDVNGEEQEGVCYYQLTVKNGQRCSAAVAYLHPAMKRPNLGVETNALTTRILFEGKRAVGVEYRQDGVLKKARARHEVILSGGAINSPQLLQLSGVGPGATSARPQYRGGQRPAGRRREPSGPLRHQPDLAAEGGHGLGQRADQRLPLRRRDAQVRLPAQGAADPVRRPHRRLRQVAARTSPDPTSSSTSCPPPWTWRSS